MKLKTNMTKTIGLRCTEEEHQKHKELMRDGIDISLMMRELILEAYRERFGK